LDDPLQSLAIVLASYNINLTLSAQMDWLHNNCCSEKWSVWSWTNSGSYGPTFWAPASANPLFPMFAVTEAV